MSNLTKTKIITIAAIASASLLMPIDVYSLGIGEIKLQSKLNQNLRAEIELLTSPNEDISDLYVGFASPEKFDEAGIPWSYVFKNMKFKPVKKANGSMVIQVTSNEPLKEFFLNFVLELDWNKSKVLYREFTLLVDPPNDYVPAAERTVSSRHQDSQDEESEADLPSIATHNNTPRRVKKTVHRHRVPYRVFERIGNVDRNQYGPTKETDSIRKIAQKTRYDDVSVEQMMVAIVNANPDAFNEGNINSLATGQTLKLPAREVALEVSHRDARDAVKEQDNEWRDLQAAKAQTKKPVLNLKTVTEIVKEPPQTLQKPVEQKPSVSAVVSPKPVAPKVEKPQPPAPVTIPAPQNVAAVAKPDTTQMQPNQTVSKDVKPTHEIHFAQPNKSPAAGTAVNGNVPVAVAQAPLAANQPGQFAGTTSLNGKLKTNAIPLAAQGEAGQTIPLTTNAVSKPSSSALHITTHKSSGLNKLKSDSNKPIPDATEPASEEEDLGADFITLLLYGLGGGVLFGLLGLFLWLKRNKQLKTSPKRSIDSTSKSLNPASVEIMDTTGDFLPPSAQDVFESKDHKIDPCMEADVYLTYSLYEKAESLIKQAIEDNPSKDKFKLKLLEIYFASKNRTAFKSYMGQLTTLGKRNDHDFWSKVAKMEESFKADAKNSSEERDENADVAPLSSQESTYKPQATVSHASAAGAVSLAKQQYAEPQNSPTVENTQSTPKGEDSFDLSAFDVEQKPNPNINSIENEQATTANKTEFDLSDFDREPAEQARNSYAANNSQIITSNEIAFDLSDFDREESPATSSEISVAGNEIAFDLSGFDKEQATENDSEPVADNQAAENAIAFDLSGFDTEQAVESATDVQQAGNEITFDISEFDEPAAETNSQEENNQISGNEISFDVSEIDDAFSEAELNDEVEAEDDVQAYEDNEETFDISAFDDHETTSLHGEETHFDLAAFNDNEAKLIAEADNEAFDAESTAETYDLSGFDEESVADKDEDEELEDLYAFDDAQQPEVVERPINEDADIDTIDEDASGFDLSDFEVETENTTLHYSETVETEDVESEFDLNEFEVEESPNRSHYAENTETAEDTEFGFDLSVFKVEDDVKNQADENQESFDLSDFEVEADVAPSRTIVEAEIPEQTDSDEEGFDLSDFDVEDAEINRPVQETVSPTDATADDKFDWVSFDAPEDIENNQPFFDPNEAETKANAERLALAANQDKNDNTLFDPTAALEFFILFGKAESVKKGETIFHQKPKGGFLSLQSDKMYLLVEGMIKIKAASGKEENILSGGLFGELTPFPARSNSAVAEVPSKLRSLSEKQLLTGLKSKPEFIIMLMGLFIHNIRKVESEAKAVSADDENQKIASSANVNKPKSSVLSPKVMQELVKKLGDNAVMSVPQQRVIFKAGGAAMLMYIILEGEMSIQVGHTVVGHSGPGDIVGEIALVDQKPRTATVIAETPCSLLAINRDTLLDLIQTLPTFGISLLRVLASRLSFRIDPTDDLDDWDW